tara:strand:- start:269 stop:412 length:144 start_codon:yes stop_codon:yes gene_type:complete
LRELLIREAREAWKRLIDQGERRTLLGDYREGLAILNTYRGKEITQH